MDATRVAALQENVEEPKKKMGLVEVEWPK